MVFLFISQGGFKKVAYAVRNIELMSYLSGIYLESWFSWFRGGVQKHWKKNQMNRQKKKIDKLRARKTKNTGKI